MAAFGIRIFPENLRSLDSSTFAGNYVAIGGPTQQHGVIVRFVNDSTVSVTVSWNGIDDHMILPKGSFVLLDIASNDELNNYLYITAETQFYIKGSAGTGLIYMEYYYTY